MDSPPGAEGGTQNGRREGQEQPVNVVASERLSEYSNSILKMIIAIFLACYPAMQYITRHAKPFYFMVCCGLLLVTFLADLLLLFLASVPCGSTSGRLEISLVYFINIFTMLSSTSLLLLLNTSYAMLAILMSPIIAIVGIAFYKGANRDQLHDVETELKKFFNLSALVTADAIAGMLSVIIGYFQNFREDIDLVPIKFSMAFIFFTIIIGLLLMLLTTVPPLLNRTRLIIFLEVLSYALFGLLALVGLTVAAEFLNEFILLAFFHIFLALVVWFMEFIQEHERQATGGENQEHGRQVDSAIGGENQAHERQVDSATGGENESGNFSTTITIFIFAVMMEIYSVYFNSEDYGLVLKTCMFFMLMTFVPSLNWMLLTFRPSKTKNSLKRVVYLLTCFTIFWLVLAMLNFIALAIIKLQIMF